MCGAQFRNVARNLVQLKHKDLFYTVCVIYKSSEMSVCLHVRDERLAGKHSIMKHNAFILVNHRIY